MGDWLWVISYWLLVNCPNFFSHEPFYLVAPGFVCVFMSIWKKNTCFWVEYNLQLYLERNRYRKIYI